MAKELFCTTTEPAVATTAGKVKGYRFDGIYTFLGIPYAKAKRFEVPTEPDSWEGLRDATNWGFTCPTIDRSAAKDMVPRRFWVESEDCQNLNVWSPDLNPAEKKPVLVWIHGGGYEMGSPFFHPDYEGDELAAYGDCVVVSISHRLNLLGYLDLSAFGEKYWNTGNLGMVDLVMALKWIQKNIANFGGDPDNVTICGQSGGGGKVTTLLQMAESEGLFHKAVVMSGVLSQEMGLMNTTPGGMMMLVRAMMKELGIENEDVAALVAIPYRQMADAYLNVLPELKAQGIAISFAPVPNACYAGFPTEVGFIERKTPVPLLVGTVIGEFANTLVKIPNRNSLSDEEAREYLRGRFGDATEQAIELYRKAYPQRRLIDLLCVDARFCMATINFLDYCAEHYPAPVYRYLLDYNFPIDDGKPAWHSSDQAFQFHTVSKVVFSHDPAHSDRLEEEYAGMWINLGRYGTPMGKQFPVEWRPYTKDDPAAMLIGENTRLEVAHDHALIRLLYSLEAGTAFQAVSSARGMV